MPRRPRRIAMAASAAVAVRALAILGYREEVQTINAKLRVKGGYSDAHSIQRTLDLYKNERGHYPETLEEAFAPSLGFAQDWELPHIKSRTKVTFLPVAHQGLILTHVTVLEENPDRYNVTFVIVGGEVQKGGDWETVDHGIYIRPGEKHY